MAIINGTSGADTLTGTASADEIYGLEGNDTLTGGEGADILFGGTGADSLNGGNGVDTASYANSTVGVTVSLATGTGSGGEAEGDTLTAIEKIIGSNFNDILTASATGQTLQGGLGNDIYYVIGTGSIAVTELAGQGDDEIRTTFNSMSLAPNVERLTFIGTGNFGGAGNALDNVITGGSGDDSFSGGAGADQFIGGSGSDSVTYFDSTVGVSINLKTGVHSGIAAGDTFDSIESIIGSAYNDSFVGTAAANKFDGGSGSDVISYSSSASAVTVNLGAGTGLGGDAEGDVFVGVEKIIGSAYGDTITTSLGTHIAQGGLGNDIYYLSNSAATIIEAAGEGDDEIRTINSNVTLSANVERLTFVGTGNFSGAGNALDNVITGGAGDDYLSGGGGADQFFGAGGNDTVTYIDSTVGVSINLKTGIHSGIAAGDTFNSIESITGSAYNDSFVGTAAANKFDGAGGSSDVIDYSSSTAAVSVNLGTGTGVGGDAEGDVFVGVEKVIGSAYGDAITASLGTHIAQGGLGNDIYYLSNSAATVIEAAGEGDDEVRTINTTGTLSANVERLTFVGTGNFNGVGNASDNVITGGAGDDYLAGGGGADQFFGAGGNDTVTYSDSTVGVSINLKTGIHSGIAAGDTFNSIETISGSAYNDSFVGTAAANKFDGAGGSSDAIDYSSSAAAVSVNLGTGTGLGGDAEGDVFVGIEKAIGSVYSDTFNTNLGTHIAQGGLGNDIYYLSNSATTVIEAAGEGDDEVRTINVSGTLSANVERLTFIGSGNFNGVGNALDNTITGGSGNDVFFGGAGGDQFIGVGGTDTVSYADATSSVTVNLITGIHTGIATGDTFSSIEQFRGSSYNDTFVATAGADYIDAGGGTDTIDYSNSAAAINVNLTTGVVSGGSAAGDTLSAFERVVGSSFNDTLTASTAGHTLVGGLGDDIYFISGSASVQENAGEGDDEVRTTLVNYTLGNNIERLTYTGVSAFTSHGNASNNTIKGGSGNDIFYGDAGSDNYDGGGGIDTVNFSERTQAVIVDLVNGINSGDAIGDIYTSIETFVGTSYNDVFIGNSSAHTFNGGTLGVDAVSYMNSSAAVNVNLTTNVNAGDAAGDVFASIEIIQGSNFADSLTGNANANIFVGGAGVDTIDGQGGIDDAWYLGSASGVTVDLTTGVGSGGDAAGDVLSNVENLIGSSFNDVLTGSSASNRLEGGWGDDTIYGGDGNDFIYGGSFSSTGALTALAPSSTAQADVLYGGNGADVMVTGGNDSLSVVYGEAGSDTITVNLGSAYGGADNDTLTGTGTDFLLFGGGGADRLTLAGAGSADGEDGGDTYVVTSAALAAIYDSGTSGTDIVQLKNIQSGADVTYYQLDNNLYVLSTADFSSGHLDSGVVLLDWYAGANNIETFYTNNGDSFTIPA